MRAKVEQVTTFAATPFAGNPAFVVSLEAPAPDRTLTRICDELQAGVLAVLTNLDQAEPELAFFTSEGAHPGAGHAAHAAAHVALRERSAVDFRLPSGGVLGARRAEGRIGVTWPVMPYSESALAARLTPMLGRSPAATLDASFGIVAMFDATSDLAALRPDLAALAALPRGALIATAPGDASDFALRVFAPKLGLPEDPVCGTAHRIIAPYWRRVLGRSRLRSRQMSTRGGDLWCEVDEGYVTISGESVTFLSGEVEFPISDEDDVSKDQTPNSC
jgi:predicted PhzF superfamily epimerase YddE/YHI9